MRRQRREQVGGVVVERHKTALTRYEVLACPSQPLRSDDMSMTEFTIHAPTPSRLRFCQAVAANPPIIVPTSPATTSTAPKNSPALSTATP